MASVVVVTHCESEVSGPTVKGILSFDRRMWLTVILISFRGEVAQVDKREGSRSLRALLS
jgi:hypothetical protein